MARHRWTLALILVCLTIAATVITAFRVRDLPRSSQEILKSDSKKQQKCDDCDVNELKVGQKLHSAKIESAKRSYEDLKKAVREKQQSIGQKILETKPSYKYEDDSDDEDNHDFLQSKAGSRLQEQLKVSKVGKSGFHSTSKLEIRSKKSVISDEQHDDDDNDNDDDEDEDDSDDIVDKRHKGLDLKKKVDTTMKQDLKKIKGKKSMFSLFVLGNDKDDDDDSESDDDDDDDDDDDEEDDDDDILHKKLAPITIQKKDIKTAPAVKETFVKKSTLQEEKKSASVKPKENKIKPDAKSPEHSEIKTDSKKIQPIKKELKSTETKQKLADNDDVTKKLSEQSKPKIIPSTMPVLKKDEKKERKEPKPKDEKLIKELVKEESKKHEEPEKDAVKLKPSQEQKESKVHRREEVVVEKKPVPEPKKKDDKPKIIELKKDIEFKADQKRQKEHEKIEKSSHEMLVDSQVSLTSAEKHMKHVTDALHRRNLLKSEFEDFYAFFPTFAPNFSRIHNPECRRHGQILLRQLRGTKLWALNMLDATAKIPSGILQGNGIQLGDFDQCLGSRARVQLDTGSVVKVQGKYCLARLDVKAEHPELEVPVHLAQAKNLIKSRIDDPGHFVPRFSTLSWGVCVPSACNPEDVELVVKDAIKHYQRVSGVAFKVKVDEQDCHTQEGARWEDWLEWPTILTLSFYVIVILLVLVATVQDFIGGRKTDEGQGTEEADEKAECDQKESKDDEKKKGADAKKGSDGFLSAFSLYRTVNKLVAPGTTDDISCIHGVRAIATIALLTAHKFVPVGVIPYTNRLRVTEVASSPLMSWSRAGWMYTDCFLLLSGALTAHRMSADNDTTAPKRLLSRYLRLTPALLAVVLFYAYIWDNLSAGPMWGTLVTKNAEICQQSWWWNLLYVQNYFGLEEMCAPQTHQLALDMQLTIFGYLIVWMTQVNSGLMKLLLPGVHIVVAYSRYATVRDHRLTMLAYHGVSVSQLYRTARLSYTSILHRSTSYLVGLSLGLSLQKPSRLNKFVLILGWIFSAVLWGLVWWAGFDSGSTQFRYSVSFAAQYAALTPIATALAIAWLIYAVHNGHCEILSRLLCCRPLAFISRLSYALYLCQFIVFLTNAATVKTSTEFTLISLIDIQEISLIILSSTILTLTLIIPMQSLHKVCSFKTSSKNQEEIDKVDKTEQKNQTQTNSLGGNEEIIDLPQIRSRQHLLAHREVLEEIPETEVEYEMQRERNEALEEILEEEEDEAVDEDMGNNLDEEEMEIIEEEQGGEDDFWAEREEYTRRRNHPEEVEEEEQDFDEWEWTANGSGRNGAQYYRYAR